MFYEHFGNDILAVRSIGHNMMRMDRETSKAYKAIPFSTDCGRLGHLIVTDEAAEALAEMLAGVQVIGHCVRLKIQNEAAYLAIDRPKPGDQRLIHRGEPILVADFEILQECAGYVLGFESGRFRIWRAADAN